MNNSESARKLNQAVNNTGRAVGEALSQAKGAFSSFWSTFAAPPSVAVPVVSSGGGGGSDNNSKSQVKSNAIDPIEPKEITEAREGVIKNIAKKFHNNDLSLKQEKKTAATKSDGIVEIGREAGTLDANRSNEIIDI